MISRGITEAQKAVVIGENMTKRVIPYAKKLGAGYYKPRTSSPPENWLRNNQRWVDKQMRLGVAIIDIGPDMKRREIGVASPYYTMERERIRSRSYPWY